MRQYYVYILTNQKRPLYTGVTNDLVRRIYEHKQKSVDGFAKKYNLSWVAYYETADDIKGNRVGTLYANGDIADATFTDLFEGEELNNASVIDLARVQMFFFTIVIAISYAVLLFEQISTGEFATMDAFPRLGQGALALLGISHAGYLGGKSLDNTPNA